MTTTTYHGYTIIRVGLDYYVYRPGHEIEPDHRAQSVAAAKRWIDAERELARIRSRLSMRRTKW